MCTSAVEQVQQALDLDVPNPAAAALQASHTDVHILMYASAALGRDIPATLI